MRFVRNVLCWIFAANCLGYTFFSARSLPNAIRQQHALSLLHILLIPPAFSVAVALICGIAWWTVWKRKQSAKGWAIAASIMYILDFLRQFIIPLHMWGKDIEGLFIGVVGLVAFLWGNDEQPQQAGGPPSRRTAI
jgi:hypothetical protein